VGAATCSEAASHSLHQIKIAWHAGVGPLLRAATPLSSEIKLGREISDRSINPSGYQMIRKASGRELLCPVADSAAIARAVLFSSGYSK
jgi:hypothetical protein